MSVMDLNKILMESAELDERLHEFWLTDGLNAPDKMRCAAILCRVVYEHAESIKMLLARGNFTSAIGLMRLQYESLVRAFWVVYAATDGFVTKLMAELTDEAARVANKIPMLSEMLNSLDGKAPKEATDMLLEFKEYSWKPLSSYIHGGIHAIDRNRRGYPLPLLLQLLKASNGISIMAAMLLVILYKNPAHKGKLPAIQREFADCLPRPSVKA
jgi:hypothetical protein